MVGASNAPDCMPLQDGTNHAVPCHGKPWSAVCRMGPPPTTLYILFEKLSRTRSVEVFLSQGSGYVLGSRRPERDGRQSTTAGARPRARCKLLRRARRRRPRAARENAAGTASRVRVGSERGGSVGGVAQKRGGDDLYSGRRNSSGTQPVVPA